MTARLRLIKAALKVLGEAKLPECVGLVESGLRDVSNTVLAFLKMAGFQEIADSLNKTQNLQLSHVSECCKLELTLEVLEKDDGDKEDPKLDKAIKNALVLVDSRLLETFNNAVEVLKGTGNETVAVSLISIRDSGEQLKKGPTTAHDSTPIINQGVLLRRAKCMYKDCEAGDFPSGKDADEHVRKAHEITHGTHKHYQTYP